MRRILLTILPFLFTCIAFSTHANDNYPFSVNTNQLTIWNGSEYNPFFLKGVNLGIAKPGTSPGELEATRAQYSLWFDQIKDAGFNCIRIYTLHYPHFYEELLKYNTNHPQHPLFFIQGVWLNEENTGLLHDLTQFTDTFKAEIRENIDCVHGNKIIGPRFGKAFGTYTADVSKWNMAYLIGREILPIEVISTDKLHVATTSFSGQHLKIANATATECWLTSHLDYVINYEKLTYNTERPVSASSWPTLDPIIHRSEPNREEDTASVDLSKIELINAPAGFFVSYHAYPYYPDFISLDTTYMKFSDNYGANSYLGYLTDLKKHYSKFPLIIAEFGVPSSWGIAHYATSGMNHGGHDETSQGEINMRMLSTFQTANTGGGIQFAWMDEWFKRTWITDAIDSINRPLWDNVTAAEQNFGLIKFVSTKDFTTVKTFTQSDELTYIKAKAGYDFFELEIGLKKPMDILGDCWVAFDTYDSALGESLLPTAVKLPYRSEFALYFTQSSAQLYVTEAYDLFGLYHQVTTDKQKLQSITTDGAPWNPVRWKNNNGDQDVQYIGQLKLNHSFQPASSEDAVTISPTKIRIRLPWSLLQFIDPSQMRVFHDNKSTAIAENRVSDGIALSIQYKNNMYQTDTRFNWNKWTSVKDSDVVQEFKSSYWTMYDQLQKFNSPAVAFTDSFDFSSSIFPVSIPVEKGLLNNDFDLDGQVMIAVLDKAPKNGYVDLNTDGSFSYFQKNSFVGTDSFSYSIFDGQNLSKPTKVKLIMNSNENTDSIAYKPILLTINPNPAIDFAMIKSELKISTIRIFDLNGKFISKYSVNDTYYKLNLTNYQRGIYIILAEIGGRAFSEKMIVK